MKIYLAGPMRGLPDQNFPVFNEVAEWLRAKGYTVFNPADHEEMPDFVPTGTKHPKLREYLARDMEFIAKEADAIYMLLGWEQSLGARAEHALATALGIHIFYQTGIEDFEWKEHADAI